MPPRKRGGIKSRHASRGVVLVLLLLAGAGAAFFIFIGRTAGTSKGDAGEAAAGASAFADQAAAAAVDGGASAAARFVSKLLKEHRVLIFSKSYCPYSMRGKDVMRRAVGGAVEVHAVELDQLDEGHDPGMADIQDELRALTGARTVPRVFVDGQSIGGADDVGAKAQSGELEALLRGSGIIQA